jgi:hypothetical protein
MESLRARRNTPLGRPADDSVRRGHAKSSVEPRLGSLPQSPQSELTTLWREALETYPGEVTRRHLRDVARRVSADARAAGLRPEQLVVAIKESWAAHHDDAHPNPGRKLLQPMVTELISDCIEEFYRNPVSGAS